MKKLRIANSTRDMIAAQTLPGYFFTGRGQQLPDGSWLIPVDDEVAGVVEQKRLIGESDDDVVSRLVRAAIGSRPN